MTLHRVWGHEYVECRWVRDAKQGRRRTRWWEAKTPLLSVTCLMNDFLIEQPVKKKKNTKKKR